MTKGSTSVAKKVLCSALSAAMVVAFAPAVGVAVGSSDGVAYAAENNSRISSDAIKVTADKSLQQAFNEVEDGGEIVLTKDIELEDTATFNKQGFDGGVTLDLAGHSISFKEGKGKSTPINLSGAETRFTIRDSSSKGRIDGTGSYDEIDGDKSIKKGSNAITAESGIRLTLEDVTIHCGNATDVEAKNAGEAIIANEATVVLKRGFVDSCNALLANGENGRIVVDGASVNVTNDYGIYCKDGGVARIKSGSVTSLYAAFTGNNITGDMNFIIEGGILTAKQGPALYMPGPVSLDMTGGTLNGGISLRMGQIDISGGTINAISNNIDNPAEYYDYSGNAWLPDALYVLGGTYTADDNKLNLNISGGTFNCLNKQGSAVAIYDCGNVAQNMKVSVSGNAVFNTNSTNRSAYQVLSLSEIGVTNPKDGYGKADLVGKVESKLRGGTYSTEPASNYVASGYASKKIGSSWSVDIAESSSVVAQRLDKNGQYVGDITDLSEAFPSSESSDANWDGTVRLLRDITDVKDTFVASENRDITLDLNGKSITGNVAGIGNGSKAAGGLFLVKDAQKFTVKGNGRIENKATGRAPVFSVEESSLVVENGSFTTAGYAVLDNFAYTHIKSGNFNAGHANAANDKSAIYVTGKNDEDEVEASLEFEAGSLNAPGAFGICEKTNANVILGTENGHGPSITSAKAAVASDSNSDSCSSTIYGGTYTSGYASSNTTTADKENCVLYLPAGTLQIDNGTFKAAAKNTAIICASDSNPDLRITIANGKFDATEGDSIIRAHKITTSQSRNASKFISFNNGVFKYSGASLAHFTGNNKFEDFIYGGSYSSDPTAYISAYTTKIAKKSGGMWTVMEREHAASHKWGEWTIVKQATCTEAGLKTRTCIGDTADNDADGCGATESAAIPALGHRFTTGSINWTNGGVSTATATFTCAHNSSHKQVVTASISKKLTTKPTCTVKGINTYTATATSSTGTTISSSKTVQDEPALGHAFGPYTVTVQPTTYSTGLATAKCTRTGCTKTETKTIEKLKSTQTAMVGYSSVGVTIVDAKPATTPNGTHVVGTVSIDSISSLATKAEIPETVTIKGAEYAVTSISAKAFAGNTKITSASIPETVTSLPTGLFKDCSSLATVKLPSKITEIPADTFNGTAIANIVLPATVTKIGNRAFKGTELASVSLPSNLSSLGKDAFKDCKKLTGVTLPSGLKTLPSGAFSGCSALKGIAPAAGVKALDVAGTTPTTVDISKVTTIGANAFKGCKSITTVNAPKATKIGAGAFSGTTKLKSLKTGTGLKSIGKSALSGNKKLKTLELKTKKLTKSGVKSSLKGSAVKTVSIKVAGSKKTKAKYVASYKKIFTAKNCGKKVSVK